MPVVGIQDAYCQKWRTNSLGERPMRWPDKGKACCNNWLIIEAVLLHKPSIRFNFDRHSQQMFLYDYFCGTEHAKTTGCRHRQSTCHNGFFGLSKVNKQWQLVDEHGDVIDQDDNSSTTSDWSLMRLDSDLGSCGRSRSISTAASSLRDLSTTSDGDSTSTTDGITPTGGHRSSLPNSMDPPVRSYPTAGSSEHASRIQGTTNHSSRLVHPRGASSTLASLSPGLDYPDPVEFCHSSARWNASVHVNRRRSHRSNQCVDAQRTKCLRRGPMVNSGFQRKQVSLMSGGQLPRGRNFPTLKG